MGLKAVKNGTTKTVDTEPTIYASFIAGEMFLKTFMNKNKIKPGTKS